MKGIARARIAYAPPAMPFDDEEMEPSPEHECVVKIVSANFSSGSKWRLMDGNSTFWASMRDDDFNARVKSGDVSFTNGDMLKIKYYTQQHIKNGNLSTDHVVTKVIEFRKRPQQIDLKIG